MQALLARIGIARDAVVHVWRSRAGASGWSRKRCGPAATTDLWRQRPPIRHFEAHADTALAHASTVIEAANPEEEALAIAVALREAVHDGKTAALVTPDRALGRRVLAALTRWNIAAEDSGGDALADTPAGIFARLAAAAALDGLPPVTLLPCSSIRCCGSAMPEANVRPPRSSARSCADRGRAPAAAACPRAGELSRTSSTNFAAASRSICILPIRAPN